MRERFNFEEIEYFLVNTCLQRPDKFEVPRSGEVDRLLGFVQNGSEVFSWANRLLNEFIGVNRLRDRTDAQQLRLRVAMHLSPPEAIGFDPTSKTSRRLLIQEHLRTFYKVEDSKLESLSRIAASVLDEWDAQRERGLSQYRERILQKQDYRCNACQLSFFDQARQDREEESIACGEFDPYKPYFDGQGYIESMSPEVDHIAVISKDGTNSLENLQVLCALCNAGKGDARGISAEQELKFAHLPIDQVPRGHRIRMFFARIQIDNFKCRLCNSESKEITVRKRRVRGSYVLSNLYTVCYACASEQSQ